MGVEAQTPRLLVRLRPAGNADRGRWLAGVRGPVPYLLAALWLTLCLHGPLIAAAQFRESFDAGVHEFFADHYLRAWFDLWEPRWYGGFSVASYPPLTHQLLAILAWPLGHETAFGALLLAVLLAYPLAVYRFSRLFVGEQASRYAALATPVLPALGLSGHLFGQLPTLLSSLGVLLLLPALAEYLDSGRLRALGLTVALGGAIAAAHHATFLFWLPLACAAMVARALFLAQRPRQRAIGLRAGIAAGLLGAAVLTVILPFWLWRLTAWVDQAPIYHPSRDNFLVNTRAQNLFFWPEYGPLVAIFGFAAAGLRRRRTAPLAALLGLLFTLGLGGTTPLPRLLYRGMADWLTFDRFAYWAALLTLPFAGQAIAWWRLRWAGSSRGRWLATAGPALFLALLALYSLEGGTRSLLKPTQPKAIDLAPIAAFLDRDDHAAWRYLTFGFGDQAARLNYLTVATTVDGSYHTARSSPVLTASGIGQIDFALWWEPGGRALDLILDRARDDHVRWAFANDPLYVAYLVRHGWVYREMLPNGVYVWELPRVEPVPPAPPRPLALSGILWGTLPLASLAAALAFAGVRSSGFGVRGRQRAP